MNAAEPIQPRDVPTPEVLTTTTRWATYRWTRDERSNLRLNDFTVSPFTARALAGSLPAKEISR